MLDNEWICEWINDKEWETNALVKLELNISKKIMQHEFCCNPNHVTAIFIKQTLKSFF